MLETGLALTLGQPFGHLRGRFCTEDLPMPGGYQVVGSDRSSVPAQEHLRDGMLDRYAGLVGGDS